MFTRVTLDTHAPTPGGGPGPHRQHLQEAYLCTHAPVSYHTRGTEYTCILIHVYLPQVEGLVHIANICKKPIQSPTDVVKKGEEVWVKVGGP